MRRCLPVALAAGASLALLLAGETQTDSGVQVEQREGGAVPSVAYSAYARSEIEREFRAQVHRPIAPDELAEALWIFEARARALPIDVARESIAREHRNLEVRADLESRGVMGMARNLAGGGAGPLEELVATREAVETLFLRAHAERRLAVSSPATLAAAVTAGATLQLPSGVFELGNMLATPEPFPADVTLAGAGIDSTLIVLAEPLDAGGPLERFAVRDCTLLTRAARILVQRVGPAVLRLHGVRVVGFDQGADKSGLLACSTALVLDARNCRFEGGFGPVPGSGTLFTAPRESIVARFEECSFTLLSVRIQRHPRGSTLRFERCRFERLLDDPLADAERRRGIRFEECEASRIAVGTEPLPARSLEELFPGWSRRLTR